MRYFLSFLFFTIYLFGFDYHLKPYRISKGINCFFGLPSSISKDNGGNMINSCYIEYKDGYIVVDSGPTYSYAQATYEIMKKEKNLPVKYVINTSSEEVHILGNGFFKEQGAILVGSKNYKKHIIQNKKLKISDKISQDALINTRLVPLDKYLESDWILPLRDLKINIIKIKNDNEHLMVYIPDKKIIFAGDMIFNNRIVAFKNNRSILTWLDGLSLLKSLSWDDIVSAHGYMTKRSALKNTQSYLSLLKSEVKSSVLSGESKDAAIKNIKLSAFNEERLYTFWHDKNVASVYDEFLNMEENRKDKVSKKANSISNIVVKKTVEVKKIVKKDIVIPKIKKENTVSYVSFSKAIKDAESKNKIIFLKVRSTTCKYCDRLDSVISSNNEVKDILNKYFEVVSVNNDYDEVPYDIRIEQTPALLFFKPESKKPLMNLTGIEALGEFLVILREVVKDGHKGRYLRP